MRFVTFPLLAVTLASTFVASATPIGNTTLTERQSCDCMSPSGCPGRCAFLQGTGGYSSDTVATTMRFRAARAGSQTRWGVSSVMMGRASPSMNDWPNNPHAGKPGVTRRLWIPVVIAVVLDDFSYKSSSRTSGGAFS
ncbi:hypothetical protein C8R47DRAFT_719100 [Mycena vitilis]|nr:hypothetical protein C8R47DRAFT_719100 [Mycena vitilis]